MRKVCVFIGSRANYSSIKSVMIAIEEHKNLVLQLVLGASALLDRFGKVEDIIIKDGFNPDYKFHNIIEGENPTTMAKSTGLGIIEMAMVLDNLKSDFVVVIGDRFEMMSVTIAAAYMNIRIIHTMGGEVTGTIDESIRHAITKFSHIHFPSNEEARKRIIKMGENKDFVFNVGCPRIDLVADTLKKNNSYDILKDNKAFFEKFQGVGGTFDLQEPFLLVSQHPVTTEFGSNRTQMEETLFALDKIRMNTILLWPNADAGSDEVSKSIRSFREKSEGNWLHAFINLPTEIYIHLMNTTSCLIGNSSSGIREGAFIGTPVVNIGTRQAKRDRGTNVIDVDYDRDQIYNAINQQILNKRHDSSTIYGDGNAGKKIVEIINDANPEIQKCIEY